MPLGENAYPALDDNGNVVVYDPDNPSIGQYQVDPNTGFVDLPGEGMVDPDWNNRGKFAQPKPAAPTAGPTAGPTAQQPFAPYSPQVPSLPGLNVQPGMASQQWEATYNMALAQEKRLRELMETVTQPQARAAIDQAIQAIRQDTYGAQVQARESQARMTGKIPRWLPQPPRFQPGAYQQYEKPGLASGPGAAPEAQPANGELMYDTVNGPKTLAQMEQELQGANWPGGEDVPTAYARTTGGPVTPRGR